MAFFDAVQYYLLDYLIPTELGALAELVLLCCIAGVVVCMGVTRLFKEPFTFGESVSATFSTGLVLYIASVVYQIVSWDLNMVPWGSTRSVVLFSIGALFVGFLAVRKYSPASLPKNLSIAAITLALAYVLGIALIYILPNSVIIGA